MKFVASFLALTLVASSAFAQTPSRRSVESTAERLQKLELLIDEVNSLKNQVSAAETSLAVDKTMTVASIVVAVGAGAVTKGLNHTLQEADVFGLVVLPFVFGAGVVTVGAVGSAGYHGYMIKMDAKQLAETQARLKIVEAKLDAKRAQILAEAK